MVAETRGNEEYVHLKSLEDEYEYMESNMPQKQAPPEEEGPQLSPNPAQQDPTEGFVEEPDDGAGSPFGLNPENWSGRYPNSDNDRKGYSGEDDNEDLSPPLSSTSYAREASKKANRWSSFGTEGNDWIPPPRNHTSGLSEEELDGAESQHYLPAGKRRPDLFDSSPLAPSNEYFTDRLHHNEDERKSNQFEEEDESRSYKLGRENEEGSPFQFYGRNGGSKSREELKAWGSEDDLD